MTYLLSEIIQRADGQTALAAKLKAIKPESRIRQGHINNWLNRGNGTVPPEWVLAVCEVDEWEATPHQLRPDLYPNPHDGLPVQFLKSKPSVERRKPEPRQRRTNQRRQRARRIADQDSI